MNVAQRAEPCSRFAGPSDVAPSGGTSFWRAALAVCATASALELALISLAHADDCTPPAIGAYAATSTDFDGTIQTQSACGAFSALPGVSSVSDPGNGGTASSRATAAGGVGVPLSLGVFARSTGIALSGSATASFSDTFALDVGQTAALRDYGELRASEDNAILHFDGPMGAEEPLANLLTNEVYTVIVEINVSGFSGEFTGATLDLTFAGVSDFAVLTAGQWSVGRGRIGVPQATSGEISFFFNDVAPPTPEDPADFDLSITASAGSDGVAEGEIDLSDPVTVGGVTVEDYLGNIVPSVSIVSGSGAPYAVTDGVAAGSVPEPSTFALIGCGLAGLGLLKRRVATRAL
jgi:PEP-CTERM motif